MTGRFTILGVLGIPAGVVQNFPGADLEMVFPLRAAAECLWALRVDGAVGLQEDGYDMTTKFCQQNDQGVRLVVQVLDQNFSPIDLSSATNLKIKLMKPDGTAVDKTALLLTDGTDGKIVYSTGSGDIDQIGLWMVQGKVTVGAEIVHTELGRLQVDRNVDNT